MSLLSVSLFSWRGAALIETYMYTRKSQHQWAAEVIAIDAAPRRHQTRLQIQAALVAGFDWVVESSEDTGNEHSLSKTARKVMPVE